MTDREKLVESIGQCCDKNLNLTNLLEFEKLILADHILADGVIVPPIQMGQKFYHIEKFKHCLIPECYPVAQVVCESTVEYVKKDIYSGNFGDSRKNFFWGDIGKTVFLTKEEAVKALEGGGE